MKKGPNGGHKTYRERWGHERYRKVKKKKNRKRAKKARQEDQ